MQYIFRKPFRIDDEPFNVNQLSSTIVDNLNIKKTLKNLVWKTFTLVYAGGGGLNIKAINLIFFLKKYLCMYQTYFVFVL